MAFGDVLWANLPPIPRGDQPPSHEQAGTRTAILIQCDEDDVRLNTRLVVPTSGQIATLRFPGTMLVQPTAANGLREPSVLLVHAIVALDKRKVGGRLGTLEGTSILELKLLLRTFLQLEGLANP